MDKEQKEKIYRLMGYKPDEPEAREFSGVKLWREPKTNRALFAEELPNLDSLDVLMGIVENKVKRLEISYWKGPPVKDGYNYLVRIPVELNNNICVSGSLIEALQSALYQLAEKE